MNVALAERVQTERDPAWAAPAFGLLALPVLLTFLLEGGDEYFAGTAGEQVIQGLAL